MMIRLNAPGDADDHAPASPSDTPDAESRDAPDTSVASAEETPVSPVTIVGEADDDDADDEETNETLMAQLDAALAAPARGGQLRKRMTWSPIEIAEQIYAIQEWLVAGYRPNEIRAKCAEMWGMRHHAANGRIQQARMNIVRDINVQERSTKAAQLLEQLEEVIKKSLATNQMSNAIGAISLQAKLLGFMKQDGQ